MEERAQKQKDLESTAKKDIEKRYDGNLLSTYKEVLTLENGKVITADFVKHPGATAILPIDGAGNIILIKQWRRSVSSIMIEIPAGCIDPGESPIDCAGRELREEIGFAARTLIPLGGIYTVPGFCNEYIHLFLAKDLYKKPLHAEDTDEIDLFPVSLDRALTMATRGEITDSKTLSAILLYQLWLAKLETQDL